MDDPAFDWSSSSTSSLPSSSSLADCLPDILDVALFYNPAILYRAYANFDFVSSLFKEGFTLPIG